MICTRCAYYKPPGRSNPLTPTCTWKPDEEQLAVLQAMLPAPLLSRVQVQTAPYHVEQCSAFTEVQQ